MYVLQFLLKRVLIVEAVQVEIIPVLITDLQSKIVRAVIIQQSPQHLKVLRQKHVLHQVRKVTVALQKNRVPHLEVQEVLHEAIVHLPEVVALEIVEAAPAAPAALLSLQAQEVVEEESKF
jgi:chromosome condensin MukBEF complex kleisin-like MukF subunit